MTNPRFGTCSWKFDSWVGLVYSRSCGTAARCLREYSEKYRTAEIDSWFYRIPDEKVVSEYLANVDGDFRFTCKIPNSVSLTHLRTGSRGGKPPVNPDFLSKELFSSFLEAVEPMSGRIDAMMLQFEYLNRQKMPSLDDFLKALDGFTADLPNGIPLAIEPRNKNYLNREYFDFMGERKLIHVYSEKIYMPHVYDVYEKYGGSEAGAAVIRLLGGDRREMEDRTGKVWDTIVEPRDDLRMVADMAKDMAAGGIEVTVNVNNHYEGCAPLTIERLSGLL